MKASRITFGSLNPSLCRFMRSSSLNQLKVPQSRLGLLGFRIFGFCLLWVFTMYSSRFIPRVVVSKCYCSLRLTYLIIILQTFQIQILIKLDQNNISIGLIVPLLLQLTLFYTILSAVFAKLKKRQKLKLTIIKFKIMSINSQIMSIHSHIPSVRLISALNHLQSATNLLPKNSKINRTIHDHLHSCLIDIKEYLQTSQQNREIVNDMQDEINRHVFQKEYIVSKHNEVLQNLEMLIFQKDYSQLQRKLDYYKSKPLDESILTFVTESANESTNPLNRSFMIQNNSEQSSRNEFLTSSRLEQINMEQKHHQKEKIKNALKVVNSQRQTFQNKQDVWLGIVYSKDAEQESIIFNADKPHTLTERSELQFSQISFTEAYQPIIVKADQKISFSNKKVKSMIHLKQKSSKKKSIPKTSVKKQPQSKKIEDNAEIEDEKIMKKKLNFITQSNQKSTRKKMMMKQLEFKQAKNSKSVKKQLTNLS